MKKSFALLVLSFLIITTFSIKAKSGWLSHYIENYSDDSSYHHEN